MKPISLLFAGISACTVLAAATQAQTLSKEDIARLLKPTDLPQFIETFRETCMSSPGNYNAIALHALDHGLHPGDALRQSGMMPNLPISEQRTFYATEGPAAPYVLVLGKQDGKVVCVLGNLKTSASAYEVDEAIDASGGFPGTRIEGDNGRSRYWVDTQTGSGIVIAPSQSTILALFKTPEAFH